MPSCETNFRYSTQTLSCCVTGRAISALSNARLDLVMNPCETRNSRYSSQMRGILYIEMSARSNVLFRALYSGESMGYLMGRANGVE